MNDRVAKSGHEVVTISIEKSQFKELTKAIQNFVKVYAAAQIRREDGTESNSRFLKVFGLTEWEIADLLGVTQQAVNKALSKSKPKKKP